MKEYECVQVKTHKDVGKQIMQWQKNGWRLFILALERMPIIPCCLGEASDWNKPTLNFPFSCCAREMVLNISELGGHILMAVSMIVVAVLIVGYAWKWPKKEA